MKDKKKKKHKKKNKKAQEFIPDPVVPVISSSAQPEPRPSNFEPQTTNMEVHKHPHHVTHQKKWPEYLLEFLMLFLAVFLGFIAENIRETSVERHREKEYMRLMVDDLKKDTANINTMVTGNRILIMGLDTLLDLLSRPQQDPSFHRESSSILLSTLTGTCQFSFQKLPLRN